MIEVNLLPGGKKRPSRGGGFSFKMPAVSGLSADPWILGAVALGVVVLGAMAWLFLGVTSRTSDLEASIAEAEADSAQYDSLITQAQALTARRDSIAAKVRIIQDIDMNRYVWSHVMDELSQALPDYTWLESVVQTSSLPNLQLRISGRVGQMYALSRFIENLEASPFLRNATLVSSDQVVQREQGAGQEAVEQVVYEFNLTVAYDQPPLEFLETVPLFEEGEAEELGGPGAAASEG